MRHECLTLSSDASQTRGWAFVVDGELTHLRPSGRVDCSDGQVLHDWCLQGLGIAWRSTWEVEDAVDKGRLTVLLAAYAAPPNGIYAVFAQRKHLPLRVRLWIDFLKHTYGDPAYWQAASAPAGRQPGRASSPRGPQSPTSASPPWRGWSRAAPASGVSRPRVARGGGRGAFCRRRPSRTW